VGIAVFVGAFLDPPTLGQVDAVLDLIGNPVGELAAPAGVAFLRAHQGGGHHDRFLGDLGIALLHQAFLAAEDDVDPRHVGFVGRQDEADITVDLGLAAVVEANFDGRGDRGLLVRLLVAVLVARGHVVRLDQGQVLGVDAGAELAGQVAVPVGLLDQVDARAVAADQTTAVEQDDEEQDDGQSQDDDASRRPPSALRFVENGIDTHDFASKAGTS
ncbi:hypothetical protein C0580_05065, partial [Candidatus Parcubacteria bacterium]